MLETLTLPSKHSMQGLYVIDALWSLQQADKLPSAPSKEFLKGNPKNKKTSFVEILVTRRLLRDHFLRLASDADRDTLASLFTLTSKAFKAFPLDGVSLEAPGLLMAEVLRDLHEGKFDPTLRSFVQDFPGGKAGRKVLNIEDAFNLYSNSNWNECARVKNFSKIQEICFDMEERNDLQ